MSAGIYCERCRPCDLRNLGIASEPPKPTHCYGTGGTPGTPGLIGSGTFCPCECKTWPHQPNQLYAVAAKEHPGDLTALRPRRPTSDGPAKAQSSVCTEPGALTQVALPAVVAEG